MLFIFLVLRFIPVFSHESCESSDQISDSSEPEACEKKDISWDELDYRAYMLKDLENRDRGELLQTYRINVAKSSRLKPNRTVPDNRPEVCRSKTYSSNLPDVSVIITYYEEPRSTLLRTIVSVLTRTEPSLLKEIVLVDDFNDDPSIGVELARIEKVNLVRNTQREGLMRSRSRGVEISQGEIVLFLDSHCEVEPGWLEPLLERVQLNPRAIVSPVIENINFETFKFEAVSTFLRGGFDWGLEFFWEYVTPSDRAEKIRNLANLNL